MVNEFYQSCTVSNHLNNNYYEYLNFITRVCTGRLNVSSHTCDTVRQQRVPAMCETVSKSYYPQDL